MDHLETCRPLLEELAEADEVAAASAARLRGTIVVGTQHVLAYHCLVPSLPAFHARHPDTPARLDVRTAGHADVPPERPTHPEGASLHGPWFGVFLPAKASAESVAKLNAAVREAIRSKEMTDAFTKIAVEQAANHPGVREPRSCRVARLERDRQGFGFGRRRLNRLLSSAPGRGLRPLVQRHHRRELPLDVLDAVLPGRVGRQPLRRRALARGAHLLPQRHAGARVVAGARGEVEADQVGLGLVVAAELQRQQLRRRG